MMKAFATGLIFLTVWSCTQIQRTADALLKPTAREVYARDFKKDNLNFREWEAVFEASKKDSLRISVPYVEEGRFHPERKFAYSYDLDLQKGERVYVEVKVPDDSIGIFIDLFQKSAGVGLSLLKSSEPGESRLDMDIEETSLYKIIIQPELFLDAPFTVLIYAQPSYDFPVAGAGNTNIQSFWGAGRDGGSRSHEGVDIFAKRGTPVVAATEGRIGFTGERGLGGKQVWLRDGLLGNSLYYAHLDSIAVSSGEKVNRGDTLGFVGNTGNAAHTPPHLHFGIYQGYGGATDPLTYIKTQPVPMAGSGYNARKAVILRNGSELRQGPSTKYIQIASLSKHDSVWVLGKSDQWFHISVSDSLKGFMHQSLLK